jgi:multiple sugar transport system substrate-binding protein
MKRRSIVKYAAVAAALSLGLTACSGGSGSDDAKTAGTVRVTLANHVWTEGIKAAIPEFEQSSGLKVELTQLGEDQLSDQYNV